MDEHKHEDLDTFVKTNENFKYNERKTRVICVITGHELPCNLVTLKSYINGKKYQQLTRNETCDVAKLEQYKEYLIPSRNGKQKLYCKITKKEINNIPYQIENHVIGRKFQRDLKLYLQASSKKEINKNNEDEEVMENAEAESDDDDKEEVQNEDDLMEVVDPEFAGGIWMPTGTQDETDEIMESEEKTVEKTVAKENIQLSKKKKKSKLKRKMKDNKKRKLDNQVSKKKKR